MEKDTQRGSAIVKALKSNSLTTLGKEYLEVGIDAMLNSDLLKEIPVVKTVVGVFETAGSFKDELLTKKVLRFFMHLSEISEEERIEMVERLNEDDKFSGKAGEAVIEILDRMSSEKKPEYAAKFFAAYARREIEYKELRRILVALEQVPSFDIEELKKFSTSTVEKLVPMDEAVILAFVNAGLGKNNGGYGGGVILPTALCQTFVEAGKL